MASASCRRVVFCARSIWRDEAASAKIPSTIATLPAICATSAHMLRLQRSMSRRVSRPSASAAHALGLSRRPRTLTRAATRPPSTGGSGKRRSLAAFRAWTVVAEFEDVGHVSLRVRVRRELAQRRRFVFFSTTVFGSVGMQQPHVDELNVLHVLSLPQDKRPGDPAR